MVEGVVSQGLGVEGGDGAMKGGLRGISLS